MSDAFRNESRGQLTMRYKEATFLQASRRARWVERHIVSRGFYATWTGQS